MKRLFLITVLFVFFSCDNDSANDCFQVTGSLVSETIAVDTFTKIRVNRDVTLILKQAETQSVIIETGENLINDVSANVVNGELQLTDNNTCNYVRDYGVTKVYVTTSNITSIRSSTQYTIESEGTLRYENLTLISEDFNDKEAFAVGDFNLNVVVNDLNIISNNISTYYITGKADRLHISFTSGNGRFQGENLIVNNVQVYHRGENDIVVNPQESLQGEIVSTGNVISKHRPDIVEVEERYKGRIIFD